MFKKIVILCMSIIVVFVFAACGNSETQSSGNTGSSEKSDVSTAQVDNNGSNSSTENKGVTKVDSDASILIAYFSWSGHTKQLAGVIQEQTGGDLFEIQPKEPYTDDINELSGIALQEQNKEARPELGAHVENIDKYDIIFVGYPNWWNNMPMPVFTFLEEYDFSGKTVIPFSTYGDGGFGRSIDSMHKTLTSATILDGLAIQENELSNAPKEVSEWLKDIGFVQ